MDHKQKNELIEKLTIDITDANNECDELLAHLNSSKFRCGNELDGYINVDDARRYVMRIKANL